MVGAVVACKVNFVTFCILWNLHIHAGIIDKAVLLGSPYLACFFAFPFDARMDGWFFMRMFCLLSFKIPLCFSHDTHGFTADVAEAERHGIGSVNVQELIAFYTYVKYRVFFFFENRNF